MELHFFKDFDFTDFWSESSYSVRDYIEEFPDDEMITSIENELGYKLPASYIELMKIQNGGLVEKSCFPTTEELRLQELWESEEIKLILFVGNSEVSL